MPCFITQSGSFLPGPPVANSDMEKHIGQLADEADVKKTVLRMNGIVSRHYAQDEKQQQTFDVYELACEAIEDCLSKRGSLDTPVSHLAAGTTYAPLSGPGLGSILHDRMQKRSRLQHPVEVSSHSGICTSAAQAMVTAIRAVQAGDHDAAICIGAEQPSKVLKATVIDPIDDRDEHSELRHSQWFMSVFLRFMLSDGAGAFLLENQPKPSGLSFHVDWTYSRSYANEAPLCMKLDNQSTRLTQDITILNRYLAPKAKEFTAEVMRAREEDLADYKIILPHLSSFFFRKKLERAMRDFSSSSEPVTYWTNLATAGNTGAASIYIMLDEFCREHEIEDGDRFMLFIPESGQFNFVMVSLTAVVR